MEFKVGDRVAVRGRTLDRKQIKVLTVARVLKRFVELDDGSKFDHFGRVYPHQNHSQTLAEPLTPWLEAEAIRQKYVRFLGKQDWSEIEVSTLSAVIRLIRD